jgi:hypothetical protein
MHTFNKIKLESYALINMRDKIKKQIKKMIKNKIQRQSKEWKPN